MNKNEAKQLGNENSCTAKDLMLVKDALYVLNGKWKIPILAVLLDGTKRFSKIRSKLDGISDHILSKELKELELNSLLEKRKVENNNAEIVVEYVPTEHTYTLLSVVTTLKDWAKLHRKVITS